MLLGKAVPMEGGNVLVGSYIAVIGVTPNQKISQVFGESKLTSCFKLDKVSLYPNIWGHGGKCY